MRICFVTQGEVGKFKEECTETYDLVLFGFNGLSEVSYEKELKGETSFFEEAALLSKAANATVVSGCITDTRGHKRKSAVVAERGRLIGVSDMLNVIDGSVNCGAALRVYDTKVGQMGVLVAEDLYFPDAIRALSLCGSEFIICPFGGVVDSIQKVLLRADAFCYGIPIFFCGNGYCMLADPFGNIAFESPSSPAIYEYRKVKEYHLIETRRRGFYRSGI